MKRIVLSSIGGLLLVSAAACGTSHGTVSTHATADAAKAKAIGQQLRANPNSQTAVNNAKQYVAHCATSSIHVLSFYSCAKQLVPTSKRPALWACEKRTFANDLITHKGRLALESGNPEFTCVLRFEK